MARLEVPLREDEFSSASMELQIQSLQSSIFQLRKDLATHSHLPVSGISGGGSIDQIIGANLDLMSRYILKDFSFESDKFAGALKSGTITWSDTTGLITSGTGFVINDKGIIGALNGEITVSILNNGSATFAGTLEAASGTLGAITIGADAWHVDSSGNMWWADYPSYADALNKISSKGIYSRLRVINDLAGTGYYYENSGNVIAYGAQIKLLGATNTGIGIRIDQDGTSGAYGMLLDITNAAQGFYLSGNTSATACYLSNSGAGKALHVFKDTVAEVAMWLEQSTTATALDIDYTGVSGFAVDLQDVGAGTSLFINKDNSGFGIDIDLDVNNANACYGLSMDLKNAGAGVEYAFYFQGSEYISTATSVSTVMGIIKVNTPEGIGYIPIYSSYA